MKTLAAFALPADPASRRGGLAPKLSWLQSVCLGVLAYVLAHSFLQVLPPPTDRDALCYHLSLPEIYLRAGGIEEIPWLLFSHWPHLAETFYTLPLMLGLDAATALAHFGCFTVLLAAVFRFTRSRFGRPVDFLAAAALAAQPTS